MINRIIAALFIHQATGILETPLVRKCYDLGRILLKLLLWAVIGIISFFGLYYVLASPPMHLVYDVAPRAGPSTIYVPGKSDMSRMSASAVE